MARNDPVNQISALPVSPRHDENTSEVKLTGPAIEEWLNVVLQKVVDEDGVPGKISKGGSSQPPAHVMRIDM